jgi:hypothetical protein
MLTGTRDSGLEKGKQLGADHWLKVTGRGSVLIQNLLIGELDNGYFTVTPNDQA